MIATKSILFPLLLLIASSSPICSADGYPIVIESIRNGQEHTVIARNQGPAPVSLKASLTETQNLASDRDWPIYVVVRPHTDLPLARLFSSDNVNGYRFGLQTSYNLGDFSALHDPRALYSLPYDNGKTFLVTQAPNGPITTHNTAYSRYAIDFAMPEGTPILAARDGIVISAIGNNIYGGKESGLMEKANFVQILHEDGTIASYVHLTPNGTAVQIGQQVSDGDLIGYAGSTGYSSGPHLHFAVTQTIKSNDGFTEISVPVNFYVGNPAITFQPQSGMMLTAEYSIPVQSPGIVPNPNLATIPATALEQYKRTSSPSTGNPVTATPENKQASQQAGSLASKISGQPIWIWLASFFLTWFVLFKILDAIVRRKKQWEIEAIRKLRD